MNKYGQMALSHWRATAPSRAAELPDPAAFFEAMGLEMQAQVTNLASMLAGSDRQGETFLQKVARLTAARRQAEEVVMSQLGWITAPSLPLDQARDREWSVAGMPAELTVEGVDPVERSLGHLDR